MKLSFLALSATLLLQAQTNMPRMTAVEPVNGKAGTEVTVTGENLTKPPVEKVYLTDGKNDIEVQATEQAATTVKFKIPASAKPGRFSLMILTSGKDPRLIE